MLTKLNPFAFVAAFAVGMLFIYLTAPTPEVIVKFPTPWNAGNVVYHHDHADTCFVYKANKAVCPADRSLIKQQPQQE
jgi:hypothetical protein